MVPGALGGAVPGIGAGIAWAEIPETLKFKGYSDMLVFLTFMPPGAPIGGLCGAFTFALVAFRDAGIALERQPQRSRNR